MSKNRRNKKYPNGGDGMFFYHKKTKHPAKQIRHSNKTWTNKRYTHSPNNISNHCIDNELSDDKEKIYYSKSTFIDSIYTRGMPYRKLNKKALLITLIVGSRANAQNSTHKAESSSNKNI